MQWHSRIECRTSVLNKEMKPFFLPTIFGAPSVVTETMFFKSMSFSASESLSAVQISVPFVVANNDVIAINSSLMKFPIQYRAETAKRADLVMSILSSIHGDIKGAELMSLFCSSVPFSACFKILSFTVFLDRGTSLMR
ncbi:hypothetical protein TNCV_1330931 [Trichonephila clavipes]|uniref:Uncharacterized protein n=1 Tax=Trichonephila clavipes TaxID=2585209 RepID=A0A8X6R984_TRICX|nr:hypothetical protein TNCV_1330931 [Trichonephila clavipes]